MRLSSDEPGFLMRRRSLLALLGATTMSGFARTEQRTYRVGVFLLYEKSARDGFPAAIPRYLKLEENLRALGFVVGKNLTLIAVPGDVEITSQGITAAQFEQARKSARTLISLNPDLIFAWGGVKVLRQLTSTIPIVFANYIDPLGVGIVRDLKRPGENVTGVAIRVDAAALKRLELVRQLLPKAKSVAIVWDRNSVTLPALLETAAERLGFKIIAGDLASHGGDLRATLADVAKLRPDALMGYAYMPTGGDIDRELGEFEAAQRIPVISGGNFANSAPQSVVAYSEDYGEHFRRAAHLIAMILKGSRPGDMPVDYTDRFIVQVDLRRAQRIGLEIPPSILLQADRVVE